MLAWFPLAFAIAVGETAPSVNQIGHDGLTNTFACECSCRRQGDWMVSETLNFSVWSRLPRSETEQLAKQCERLRMRISGSWLGESVDPQWRPKCVVVVHSDSGEYSRMVGASHNLSVGCTTTTIDQGRIVFRRIDLRSDADDWRSNALPHELTHVVLADMFREQGLPGWLNEGVAMTFETAELRERRLQVLRAARKRGTLPAIKTVLAARDVPHSADADVLYAACLSIVCYLREQGDAESFLQFAVRASENGCDTALREVYDIAGGIGELERRWLAALNAEPVPLGGAIPGRNATAATNARRHASDTIEAEMNRSNNRAAAEPFAMAVSPDSPPPSTRLSGPSILPVSPSRITSLPKPSTGVHPTFHRVPGD